MQFTSARRLTSANLLLLSLLAATPLQAQTQNGINGTVTDASGAIISDCQVDVRNDATGVVTTAHTSSSGTYTFPNLNPGTYTVTFKEQGFTTSVISGVTVETGRVSNVNKALAAGEVSTTVDVQSSAISLQTATRRSA